MNILVVSSKYQPEYSGSGYRAHNLYKRLNHKYNLKYSIVCNSLLNRNNETYKYDGIKVARISYPFNMSNMRNLSRKVHIILAMFYEFYYSYKFIKKNKITNYDLLHTFGNSWSVAFFTFYFSRHKKPIIRELVNTMEHPYYPIQYKSKIQHVFLKKNTLMIAISKQLENMCKQQKVPHMWHRPNPISEDKFLPISKTHKATLRNQLTSFSSDDILLLHMASYMQQKNHIFLLEVLNILPPNYKLYLGGPAQTDEHILCLEQVQKRVKELNLQHRVHIAHGFVDNMDEYMKMSDIFLFPTWNEALGTPILEAQACGVPVVANLMKGVTDYWIMEGRGGYVVPSFDAILWKNAIMHATQLHRSILLKNSHYILEQASTSIIDSQYVHKMKELICIK